MNTPFNIIHSPILTNIRIAGQYHYLWTGQYDKKWNTTWCIVDQSQDVCDVLYVINDVHDDKIISVKIQSHSYSSIDTAYTRPRGCSSLTLSRASWWGAGVPLSLSPQIRRLPQRQKYLSTSSGTARTQMLRIVLEKWEPGFLGFLLNWNDR